MPSKGEWLAFAGNFNILAVVYMSGSHPEEFYGAYNLCEQYRTSSQVNKNDVGGIDFYDANIRNYNPDCVDLAVRLSTTF